MKKSFTAQIFKVFIVGLLITLTHTTFSQSNIRFGLRGGAHAGTQWGRNIIYNPQGTLVGFEGAVFANIALSEDISLCPEIAFSQKGFKIDTSQITSNYIEVPLLLKINMGDEGLYTVIGPYASYLPTVNDKVYNEEALGWGGILGFGVKLGNNAFIEGRYNFSANIWRLSSDISNPYGFRNTTIGLSLGYLF